MKKTKTIVILVAFLFGSFALAGPTLADLIPGKYQCNFNSNMIVEITDDRQLVFEVPRKTPWSKILKVFGATLDKAQVRGSLNNPPEGYEAFHAIADTQDAGSYNMTLLVWILKPTRIFVEVPTLESSGFLVRYDRGGCEIMSPLSSK